MALSWSIQDQSSIEKKQNALLYEAITLNQNRILVRLRSRHAALRCSFKKRKVQRPKLIPQLYTAINARDLGQISGVAPMLFTALKADVEELHRLFTNLENLTKSEAVSSPGSEILVQIVIISQHVHDRRILDQILIRSSQLDPCSKSSIALKITKLSRYSSVPRFLLEAAQKYQVFKNIRVSAVCFRAPHLPATELDSMTTDLIHKILDGPKLRIHASKFHDLSLDTIENHLRQEATLAVPVHAEIQLLFHYERIYCEMPPRIICSSKQACYLCDLFFKIHGKFTVPNSHGRLYEKWALPKEVKSITNANSDILTKLWKFVEAIENALVRETQVARKFHPIPCESIILHSAVWVQSNQSMASARGSPASQKPIWCQSPIPACKNDTIPRTSSPLPDPRKPDTEGGIDALRSCSETKSKTIIRATSQPNTPPEYVTSSEKGMSSINFYVSLEKGQPVWQEISSKSHSIHVRTPRIHLTLSQEEPLFDQFFQKISHDVVAGFSHYWLILEYLSDSITS